MYIRGLKIWGSILHFAYNRINSWVFFFYFLRQNPNYHLFLFFTILVLCLVIEISFRLDSILFRPTHFHLSFNNPSLWQRPQALLYVPLPALECIISPIRAGFFYRRIIFQKQSMNSHYACCYWDILAFNTFQRTEEENISM